MSEHEATPASGFPQQLKINSFLMRRLHSLSGILPIGLFVCIHLFTNFQQLVGDYQHEVEFIHSLPALFILEVTLWASLAFHAGLGFYYTFQGKSNTKRYPYMDNWRYTLQRITGIIALLFIFLHVSTLRWRRDYFGYIDTPFYVAGPNGEPLVAATTSAAIQHGGIWMLLIYSIGTAAVVYHWCNGLWTAAISWGLTVSVAAQKRWGYVCLAMGIVLSIFSIGAIGAAYVRPITVDERAYIQGVTDGLKEGRPMLHKAKEKLIFPEEPPVKLDSTGATPATDPTAAD